MAAVSLPVPVAWISGATAWTITWAVLGVATVVIVVLVRTRWRSARPWQKCALLSLWVHVLLACLAATIRIGLGSAGLGSGPGGGGPIRVSIVIAEPTPAVKAPSDAAFAESEAADEKPAVVVEPAAEPESLASTSDQPAAEPPSLSAELPEPAVELEAPELLAEPVPEPPIEPDAIALDRPTPDEPPSTEVAAAPQTVATELESPTETSRLAKSSDEATSAATRSAATPAGSTRRNVPAVYANRLSDRSAVVSGGGGNPSTERAVRAALAWLAAAQEPDGRWDPKRHGAGQEQYAVLGQNRGSTGAKADTGITALALLAFLGAGHTHLDGPYADRVARGLDFLRRSQAANGNLGGDAELFAHMYCHSMAAFAMSEACAMTGDEKLLPVVRRAAAYSLAAQHPTDGGWRYQAGQTGDTSQLGWQLMALRSAELAGVDIPAVTWTRADRFLRGVERGAAGGLAAYRPEGPPSRAMTAEALFCRQLLSHRDDGGLSPAARDEARRALLEELPGGPVINYYYWYYATIALHRARHASSAADEAWQRWNEALAATLLEGQSGDGSWSSACMWGGYGGRVYTTALGAMCLEVYYRYAPSEDPNVARHDDWQAVPPR